MYTHRQMELNWTNIIDGASYRLNWTIIEGTRCGAGCEEEYFSLIEFHYYDDSIL